MLLEEKKIRKIKMLSTKTIIVIALILLLILGYNSFEILHMINNTKECRELVGKDKVNYQKTNGYDECCYNVDGKYSCYKKENLKKERIEVKQ